jgi:hypothetical protein
MNTGRCSVGLPVSAASCAIEKGQDRRSVRCRTGRFRSRVPGVATWLTVALCALLSHGAVAHNPHDPVMALGISSNFANDRTMFVSSWPEINWAYRIILRSTDGGAHWTKLPNGMDTRYDLTAIRTSPQFATDGAVYAATAGEGVYRSVDRGNTWATFNTGLTGPRIGELEIGATGSATHMLFAAAVAGGMQRRSSSAGNWSGSLPTSVIVRSIAVSPGFAADSTVMTADTSGVLRVSTDRGATWVVLGNPAGVGGLIHDVAIAPGGGGVFLATSNPGVQYSANGGTTFTSLATGLPAEAINNVAVSPNFATDRTVFCTSVTKSVYRSTDGGQTWTLHDSHAAITNQTTPLEEFSELQISNGYATDGAVFLSAFDGVFVSEDQGLNWHESQTRYGLATGVAFSPDYATDRRVMATVYGGEGMFTSTDNGATWLRVSDGWPLTPEGLLSAFDVDFVQGASPPLVVATQNDTNFGFSPDFGATWNLLEMPAAPPGDPDDVKATVLGVSPDFLVDRDLYLGTRVHGVIQSRDAGATWRFAAGMEAAQGHVTSLALSPGYALDRLVLAGLQNAQLWRSLDAGDNWAQVGQATLLSRPGRQNMWVAMSPDYTTDSLILAGTNDGVYRSTDAGITWESLGIPELGPARVVQQIEFSPAFALDHTFYALVHGFGLMRVVLTDTGAVDTVTNVGSTLLAQNVEFSDFRLSPEFATDGTLLGVAYPANAWVSTDRGNTWALAGAVASEPPNQQPELDIVSPVSGTTYTAGAPIALTANTSDPDGDPVTVSWTANGMQIAEPWTPVAGSYTVAATADDGHSGSTTESVSIDVVAGGSGTLSATVHAVGANATTAARINDVLNGSQNLATNWSNNGVNATAWFTLDLGATRAVERLLVAPRGDLRYVLTVTIGDSVSGGKVTGASTGTCIVRKGTDVVPTTLKECLVGGNGRYVTVQGDRPWLLFHGIEVVGTVPGSIGKLPTAIHDAGANDPIAPRIIDLLNGEQNLTTSWSNGGVTANGWFTIDLGTQKTIDHLSLAPKGELTYNFTVTIGNTTTGGKVNGSAGGACTIRGPTAVPTALTLCQVSGAGRYVTVQGNRPWLIVHGMEVWGSQ